MGSMSEIWDERQIQILVLLSFVLQVFLFFAGSIRYRSTNTFLRISLWLSYIGADAVAVYLLGLTSRQEDATPSERRLSDIQPLAFIWAPFLLIHLGGQDTITAFAMEDNGLWLRHLLNLVLQLVLALYVFWKSAVWHNVHLLVTGICLFLAGTIKYGERIIALKYGKLLKSYTGNDNKLPQWYVGEYSDKYNENVIGFALKMVGGARQIFDGRNIKQMAHTEPFKDFLYKEYSGSRILLKVLDVELRLIYDDLYTKALVLRRRTGIIGRSISLVSIIVCFVLFFTISDNQRYSKADMAITYALLIGDICLEVCAAFMMVLSAWTWGWLEAQRYRRLADILLWLLSSRIALLSEKRVLWSNSMGQYEYIWYTGEYNSVSMSWKQRVMKTLRAMVNFVGVGKGTVFQFSKLLDTKEVTVDEEIMELLLQRVHKEDNTLMHNPKGLPRLPPVVSEADFVHDFGGAVVRLHTFTALLSSDYPSTGDDAAVKICLKLSNYMLYLLVAHPEMLPINGSAEAILELEWTNYIVFRGSYWLHGIQPSKRSMEELRDIWIHLLMYVAGKSRPEMHAAHLARGGQLLTFVWLLMTHCHLGDLGYTRMELSGDEPRVSYSSIPLSTRVFCPDPETRLSKEAWMESLWSDEEATELAASPDRSPESVPSENYSPSACASAHASP